MIDHTRRIVFVHVPKTAGTSIETALGHHGPDGHVVRDAQDHRTLRQLQWPHVRPFELASRENVAEVLRAQKARLRQPTHLANRTRLTREQYATYLKFAVVRNPWDRTWSWFRNVSADPLQRARLGVPGDLPFAEFVTRQAGLDCLRPQTYWLHDFRGRVGVDLVCRYETLEHDWAMLCERAGLVCVDLPVVNVGSPAPDFREVYDDVTRRLVATRFREEIDRFGYRFEGR